ncbi:HK97-gp10 family putative phage morphogenesis protein [Orrella sp. 11846]|uniref:HK97-gp10 family putative phage morphogenesis protein n=1 Tax=Orrella sp. 11846 TaxID=3409913 RepID=UPI003B5C51C5
MKVDIKIRGIDNVVKTLNSLPPEIVSQRGGPAALSLAKGARMIRDQARTNILSGVAARGNVSTGLLAKNIMVTRARRGPQGFNGERYLVRVRPKVAHYAGNRRNVRLGRAGKAYLTQGPAYYGRFLEYGTSKMPAYPWLRPAVQQKGRAAIEVITQDLDNRIQKIVTQLEQKNR